MFVELQFFLDDEEPSKKESMLSKCDNIKKEFPLIIVKELLNAIKLNSYEARQRFPRLLQIVETYFDQTLDCFIKSVKRNIMILNLMQFQFFKKNYLE